jgi:hypothetical protein
MPSPLNGGQAIRRAEINIAYHFVRGISLVLA